MKRYLLLALLFGIIFLWLGKINTVEAQSSCTALNLSTRPETWKSPWGHYYTCEYPTSNVCGAGVTQDCSKGQMSCAAWLKCCICPDDPTTTPPPTTTTNDNVAQWNTDCGVNTITAANVAFVELNNWNCCESEWWDGLTWLPKCTTPAPAGNGNWGGSNWGAGTTNSDGLTNEKCKAAYHATSNPQGLGVGGKLNASELGCTCEKWYKKIDKQCVPCNTKGVCCGIELNTNVPFIGRCIEWSIDDVSNDEKAVTSEDAFPVLMGSLTQILVTIILIVSFVLIIIGGIMISTGNPSGGKSLIIKVVVGIALLGASGVILRLINPNFFG